MSPATTPPPDPADGRAWEATVTWATGVLAGDAVHPTVSRG